MRFFCISVSELRREEFRYTMIQLENESRDCKRLAFSVKEFPPSTVTDSPLVGLYINPNPRGLAF